MNLDRMLQPKTEYAYISIPDMVPWGADKLLTNIAGFYLCEWNLFAFKNDGVSQIQVDFRYSSSQVNIWS